MKTFGFSSLVATVGAIKTDVNVPESGTVNNAAKLLEQMNKGELVITNGPAETFGNVTHLALDMQQQQASNQHLRLNNMVTNYMQKNKAQQQPDADDSRWDLFFNCESHIGIAVNGLAKRGPRIERVDLPWNRCEMSMKMTAPADENSGESSGGDEAAFKGSFNWQFGNWVTYTPLSVKPGRSSSHHHAMHAFMNADMPDSADAARAYSLLERTEHLKKLMDPKVFEKTVKQLLLLEKFKTNPMALRRFLEISKNEQEEESDKVRPTSLAEMVAGGPSNVIGEGMDNLHKMVTPALMEALNGVGIETWTLMGSNMAFIGKNSDTMAPPNDPVASAIQFELIGSIMKRVGNGAHVPSISLKVSLAGYSFAGYDNAGDNPLRGTSRWETGFGGVRGSSFKFNRNGDHFSAIDNPLWCRIFEDYSVFCGVPFFKASAPKTCLTCANV